MRGRGRVFYSGAWDGARGVEPTKPCDSFSCIHPQFDFWYFCTFCMFLYLLVLFRSLLVLLVLFGEMGPAKLSLATKPCDSFSCINPQFDFWYFLYAVVLFGTFFIFWYFGTFGTSGPWSWACPRYPAIHSHAFTRNLLSKRALSYSSQSHYYPYHCQRQRENKEVTN